MKNEDKIVELLSGMLKKQDHHSELLTALVQRMDSKEVADQRRFEAIDKRFDSMDKRFENMEVELKETNRILTSVAHVVSNLVITNQATYVELSEKIRGLEEKVYGQAS
jgi:hypothetical protein